VGSLSDDDGREKMLLLKKKEMFPTEMAEHFNFTLSTFSSHLPLLKDADLITGKKQVLFIESKGNLGIHIFFEDMYDYKLKSKNK
jgi:DNA-binding transcriptional ArsR family regulator